MKVSSSKSQRATADVIQLFIDNHDLCTRAASCVKSGGDSAAVEAILKAEFRQVAFQVETSLRKARCKARGQADFRNMWWNFEQSVDWTFIARSVTEGEMSQ